MIWLIDEGDSYHQMITLVIKGEKNPEEAILRYRKKRDIHCEEWGHLEKEADKAVGRAPRVSKTCTSEKDFEKWREARRKWSVKQLAWINKRLQNPAPIIKNDLERAGYEVMEFKTVAIEVPDDWQ